MSNKSAQRIEQSHSVQQKQKTLATSLEQNAFVDKKKTVVKLQFELISQAY
jgi:hypothetical protein